MYNMYNNYDIFEIDAQKWEGTEKNSFLKLI